MSCSTTPAGPTPSRTGLPALSAALTQCDFSHRTPSALHELEPDALHDAETLALAQKVEYEVNPNSPFPKYYSGEVIVRPMDGRAVSHREEINLGSSDRPLSAGEIVAKYRENAAMSLSGIINSHLTMASAVQCHGTQAQKSLYLRRFATGELRGGIGLTEPDAGTDLQAIHARGATARTTW